MRRLLHRKGKVLDDGSAQHGRIDRERHGDVPGVLSTGRPQGPEGEDSKPLVLFRMESGVTIFWDTIIVATYDPARTAPTGGYQVMLEFLLADTRAVESKYEELTASGYHGRSAPQQTMGPYAAMVDDPDGNVVLLTAE